MSRPKKTSLGTFLSVAVALAAMGLALAPPVASRADAAASPAAHRFVPTTVEIAPHSEEAAPTF